MEFNPLLLIDFYKATHAQMYPQNLTRLVSYYTPRMSRLGDIDKVTFFGLQGFIKEYLIEGFNKYFFERDEEEVIAEYTRIMDSTLGKGAWGTPDRIRDLHRLGELPLKIRSVPEGMRTPIGTPQIEITNTHPDFVWLVNTIETMLSCYMWHTQISAEVGYRYRKIVDKYVDMTCEKGVDPRNMLGDFSLRGQQSMESGTKSSAGWLLSFNNTATVPAIMYLEKYYNCDATKEVVGRGAISTEHSVMCSNYAVDGDEVTFIRRLLTEIYPHHSFSMVSDSYDYEHLVTQILPQLKEEILAHDGTLSIRGDSGDPVEVVTTTVFHLWNIFGGTINSKGYKVLNPHVKAIYGDSITPDRCERIYKILAENGFAINNVSLGVGSFSFMCLEHADDGSFSPYTRDTFGIAVKATYAEDENGKPIFIYKQPKGTSWKKSQKGCCVVYEDGSYKDELTYYDVDTDPNNIMDIRFYNSKNYDTSLKKIKEKMYE